MEKLNNTTTLVGGKLLGDAWTGPYRGITLGEEVDPEDVHMLHRHAASETLVPVSIYGHNQKGGGES
jgi:hypothetical protein